MSQIDLLQGWPAPSMLPVSRLKRASHDVLSNNTIFETGLEYGPDEGHYPLRKNIASWLSQSYKTTQPILAERICITGGASQNLACVLQVFTDPAVTQMVWLVEPTYHLGMRIFEDAGFAGRLRGVPEDEDGIDVEALEGGLEGFEREDGCRDAMVSISISIFTFIGVCVFVGSGLISRNRSRGISLTGLTGRYIDMLSIVCQVSRIRQGRL
jgi:hypothetical protein